MANELLANEVISPLPEVALSEPDYRAFCAALEASARGRVFLAEYARRNRHADTETVLAALDRLEALVARQSASSDADRIRQELRALLAAIGSAQPAIDASAAAIKAAKLAALIGFVQHRIESIVVPGRESSALPPEVAALILPGEAAPEAARSYLSVVPPAEQPELPIPSPAAGPLPAITLVHDPEKWEPVFGQDHAQIKHVQTSVAATAEPQVAQVEDDIPPPAPEMIKPAPEVTPPAPDTVQRSVAIMPEVSVFDSAPANATIAEPVVAEIVVVETVATEIAAAPPPAAFELTLPPPAVKRPAASAEDDPLAHIMALSDEERIALFS